MTSAETGHPETEPAREQTRRRVIEAATELLARDGRDAVTTRAVAVAAGVQAPAIYRLFGDKDGLLEAVAEYGYSRFVTAKRGQTEPADPVQSLRAGWDQAVEFGLANPELYRLMYAEPATISSAAFRAGMRILEGKIHRLAQTGWLRVDEELAAALIHATARGAVLTWLSLPPEQRNPALLTTLRESMITAVTNRKPSIRQTGAAGAALALRASLPEQTTLSLGERQLLIEWLDRLVAGS